jgi:hypothetical protein
MKTIANSILTALMFFSIASFAHAGDRDKKVGKTSIESTENACTSTPTTSFQSNIYQNASGRVSVIILKNDPEPVTVNIFDGNDNLLFTEKIKEDSIRQNFRMKDLDPGLYKFSLSKNGECFTKTVTVK